jgi:hypothetical protein
MYPSTCYDFSHGENAQNFEPQNFPIADYVKEA